MNEIKSKELIQSKIGLASDFPKPGILFYDFFAIFRDPVATDQLIDLIAAQVDTSKVDYILAIESRGFFIGLLLANKLQKGFMPVRKAGKLPPPVVSSPVFQLEYGDAQLEISDKLQPGDRVILVDDVLATGSTLKASLDLIEKAGASVQKVLCLLELEALQGIRKLGDVPFYAAFTDTEIKEYKAAHGEL